MPYKRVGRKVLIKRGMRWVILKTHRSVTAALKHLQTLNINVRHK